MIFSINADVEKLISERVNSGKYATPEDVVGAAIAALDQQEQFGNFETGELDSLLAEGEQSIDQEGTLDGEEAYHLMVRVIYNARDFRRLFKRKEWPSKQAPQKVPS